MDIERIDLGGVNCYLVGNRVRHVLVDTGGPLSADRTFTNRREMLLEKLSALGCTRKSLGLILLTHGDCDHAGNARFLREHLEAPIALHPGDRPLVEDLTAELALRSFRYRSPLLRLAGRLMRRQIETATRSAVDEFERFSPDLLLEDGMSLSHYGADARVLHLPGHTPGSVGLLFRDGSLIAGDTLANLFRPGPAPNADDFPALDAAVAGLRELAVGRVYPGHGAPFDFGRLRG